MAANDLWLVSLPICLFGLSVSLSLSISVSLSLCLALFFGFRPSVFLTVSSTLSLSASLTLGWWGAGMGIGTTGVPPRIVRFSGAWAGNRERMGGGAAHLEVLPTFPSRWFYRVWGCEYGRGYSLFRARSC